MIVLCTNLVFLATGSSSTSPGVLDLVLLLLSICLNSDRVAKGPLDPVDVVIFNFLDGCEHDDSSE